MAREDVTLGGYAVEAGAPDVGVDSGINLQPDSDIAVRLVARDGG